MALVITKEFFEAEYIKIIVTPVVGTQSNINLPPPPFEGTTEEAVDVASVIRDKYSNQSNSERTESLR